MKIKILLVFVFSVSLTTLFSQTNEEKELIICNYNVNADSSIHYITVGFFNLWTGGNIASKQQVLIDIGKDDLFKDCEFDLKLIKEPNGETRKFNSITEGLNYFYHRGWQLINSWSSGNTAAVYNYFIVERMK